MAWLHDFKSRIRKAQRELVPPLDLPKNRKSLGRLEPKKFYPTQPIALLRREVINQVPAGYQLYPFQFEAVNKLVDVENVLIGDDMGLGKTLEAIELDRRRRNKRHTSTGFRTLIVAPKTVLPSWEMHYIKFLPTLDTFVIDPKNRPAFLKAVLDKTHDVYICHWDALRLMPELAYEPWDHVVADEVHRAKNRKAQQTRALKKIKAKYKTGLSGTPADNRPDDLWSVLNWLWPKKYTSYWRFYNTYVDYEINPQYGYRIVTGTRNTPELHKEMKPYYVRRKKEDVLPDLPKKYYTKIWVDLDPKQRKAYDQMRTEMLAWVGEHEDMPTAAPAVIAQLVRLQQFATAYATMIDGVKRTKVWDPKVNAEIIVEKPVKLTRLADPPSTKLDALMEILYDNPTEQFVIFSQSKQLINLLARRLEAKNITHGLLTGDTSQKDRGGLVEDFQQGGLQVVAGTISAGGVGITLTAASTVVFLDRSWSPAINLQAEDRLHRIGQRSAVQVIDIMARNTVDLGRHQKLAQKMSWLKEILGDNVAPLQVLEEE